MDRTRVLVVGGYGTVGTVLSEVLAHDPRVDLVVAGRDARKAGDLARSLHAEARTVDVLDEATIPEALAGVRVVVNCWAGPFTGAPLHLPRMAAERGIDYLDVSGSYEWSERLLTLRDAAERGGATLITALGANPGIPGIAVMDAKHEVQSLESARILFVMGSKIDGISLAGLKELRHMFEVKPQCYREGQWRAPEEEGMREHVGAPFDKEVYMGVFVTRDLLTLPELTGLRELSAWSGSQSTLQGLAMVGGIWIGMTQHDGSARFLLRMLKRMGERKGNISDALIKVEVVGEAEGARVKRTVEMYCDENYATAIAPALVCQQVIEGQIQRKGVFFGTEVVPARDFMRRLGGYALHLTKTVVPA
ncbi:MAG: saccharopine dehydrogenase NADP-binding domain-containing protein [Polyangiaceae bacterium]